MYICRHGKKYLSTFPSKPAAGPWECKTTLLFLKSGFILKKRRKAEKREDGKLYDCFADLFKEYENLSRGGNIACCSKR